MKMQRKNSRVRASPVWRFFDRVVKNGHCTAVICKLCESEYKFFGNTTNLRVHLKAKHPLQWELSESSNLGDQLNDEDSTQAIKFIQIDEDGNEVDNEDSNINLVAGLQKPESDEEWLEDTLETFEKHKPRQRKVKLKKKIKREYDNTFNNRVSYYEIASNKQDSPSSQQSLVLEEHKPRDEYSAFGEYIASKLRNISSSRSRVNLQQIITTVLWQAEYGTYEDADSVRKLFSQERTELNGTTSDVIPYDRQNQHLTQ